MTCRLRWENCCCEDGCKRPARYGSLCSACIRAAPPARRAVEMMDLDDGPLLVDGRGVAWLDAVFARKL